MKTIIPIDDAATIIAYAEMAVSCAKHDNAEGADALLLALRESLKTRYDSKLLGEKIVQRLEEMKKRASQHGSIPWEHSYRQN